jgi:hypothetical protein
MTPDNEATENSPKGHLITTREKVGRSRRIEGRIRLARSPVVIVCSVGSAMEPGR